MGNRFSADNQPRKKGRGNLSVVQYIIRTTGKKVDPKSNKEQILKVIQHIYESSPNELEPLIHDPETGKPNKNTPVWVLNVISAINNDIRYGRTTTIEALFDRVFGKATQPIEGDINTSVTGNMNLSVLTTEELLQYNALLEKIKRGGESDGAK